MAEILADLLIVIGEIFLEGLIEFGPELLLDVVSRARSEDADRLDIGNSVFARIGYLGLGSVVGGLSLLVFPRQFFQLPRFYGISMLLAPVLTGVAMSLIGSTLRRREKRVVRIESFEYGFLFAFGMALVRFFFVKLS